MTEFLRFGARGLSWVFCAVFGALTIFALFAQFSFLPEDLAIKAFSFIQPIWALVLAGCAAAVLWYKGRSKLAAGLFLLAAINVVCFEDYRILQHEAEPEKTDGTPGLRVMAWNVQYFDQGLKNIVKAIVAADADIFLLSEASVPNHKKQEFQKLVYPYQMLYSSQGDTAILTRLKLTHFKEVLLPSHQPHLDKANLWEEQATRPQRSFLHATVDFNGQSISVLSLRFIAGRAASEKLWDSIPWGFYLWRTQREEVKTFISYLNSIKGPFIFGGDLNAPPSSQTITSMQKIANDAYLQKHRFGLWTFRTKVFSWQKEKNMPAIRLDYLFSSRDLKILYAERVPLTLSDHFPVSASFGIVKSSSTIFAGLGSH